MSHRLPFIFLSYFKIENLTAQIWYYSKLNFKLHIDLYVSYKLKLHSWWQEPGWWKKITNSSFPCFARIPSFLRQNSQCTLHKEPPTTQRGPDSPAFAPCTPAVANDTAHRHGLLFPCGLTVTMTRVSSQTGANRKGLGGKTWPLLLLHLQGNKVPAWPLGIMSKTQAEIVCKKHIQGEGFPRRDSRSWERVQDFGSGYSWVTDQQKEFSKGCWTVMKKTIHLKDKYKGSSVWEPENHRKQAQVCVVMLTHQWYSLRPFAKTVAHLVMQQAYVVVCLKSQISLPCLAENEIEYKHILIYTYVKCPTAI